MKTRAQASLEYMVMLAISLAVFAAILYVTKPLIATSSSPIGVDSAFRAVNKMKEAADFIYVHGHPSKTQISVYIPPNVERISLDNNNSINVRVALGEYYTDIYEVTRGKVYGNLSSLRREGYYVLNVESQPDNTINITIY
ncbi:MAG: hypothetical protein NTU61_04400 [Candidatus Altiarchaeota archaeon]|nr:hypothetical protein [Candidatus Altiarchaeota archaeon]